MALPKVMSSRYSTTLPSTGQTIEYRPYVVKEEKILMIALESQDQKQIVRAMKDVVKACVFDDIDIRKLTAFDLEWMFLKLRSKSVGEKAVVKLKCLEEECNGVTDVDIDLESVKVDGDFDKDKVIKITDDMGVTVRYPSVDDLAKYDTKKLNTFQGAVEMIVDCIDTIYDDENVYDTKDEKREDVVDFLESLSSTQFKKIADWFQSMPTVADVVEYSCMACGKKQELELRGIQSFFT
jgi:hypothetical protein